MLREDIQIFIDLGNFYQYFIYDLSKIAALLIFILKTTGLADSELKTLGINDNKVVRNSGRVNKIIKNLSKFKKLINKKFKVLTYIKAIGNFIFLIFGTRKTQNHLRQAFINILIFQYFNLEYHIQIKIDASSYAIKKLFSQLNTNGINLKPNLAKSKNLTLKSKLTKSNFSQWHLIAYFLEK